MAFELLIFTIAVALIFDFWNGVNDAANSIATVVSTRVLSPMRAVAWASWWNFAAAFGFGVSVANTVGRGIVSTNIVDERMILSALIGAILLVGTATYLGLPVSASHSLIGGLVGAGVAKAGFGILILGGITKVLVFIIVAPILGLIIGYAVMILVSRISIRMNIPRNSKVFRRLQLISAAAYSLGHGTNDAQKTMGIIAVLLFSVGMLGDEFYVPIWVILAAHAALALGTLVGGRRVIKTLGMRITRLKPVGGFSAETAGAATLIGTALGGIPASTTHTITGSIIGVGISKRFSSVRWGVARKVTWAWVATIPLSSSLAGLTYLIMNAVF